MHRNIHSFRTESIRRKKNQIIRNKKRKQQLSRTCDAFNGAQIKAVEAGMLALRREAKKIHHDNFIEAIACVATKKRGCLDYFA